MTPVLAASWANHRWLLPCCWNTDDGRSTSEVLEIVRDEGILHGSVLNILHDRLGLGKVCEDGLHVFWRHFRSRFGWKRVQNCWLSTVPTQTIFCPTWTKNPSLGSDTKRVSMHWTESTPTQCHPGGSALVCRLEKSWPQFCWCKGVLLVDYLPHLWHKTSVVSCWPVGSHVTPMMLRVRWFDRMCLVCLYVAC